MYDFRSFTVKAAFYTVYEFLALYKEYSTKKYQLSEYEQVVVIEDSAVIYIKIDYQCEFCDDPERRFMYRQDGICGLDIEELTKNTVLPKYNHAKFLRDIEEKYKLFTGYIRYARFRGIDFDYLPNNMQSHYREVVDKIPEIDLNGRLNSWVGELYSIVAYEMEAQNNEKYYAVEAIRSGVHEQVLKHADRLLKQPYEVSKTMGIGLSSINSWMDSCFIDAFKSYKNERKVKRLEEHFKYYLLGEIYFRSTFDIRPRILEYAEQLSQGKYRSVEWIPYIKPEYKWKTEELVYKIIKKMYKTSGVIYQHRPYFLKSSFGGQMSYDIFISDLKIAVEYQGKQHFEPIDYFGGEEAFKKLQQRDFEKAQLSKQHDIKIVYINYWEEVTPELIRSKIASTL